MSMLMHPCHCKTRTPWLLTCSSQTQKLRRGSSRWPSHCPPPSEFVFDACERIVYGWVWRIAAGKSLRRHPTSEAQGVDEPSARTAPTAATARGYSRWLAACGKHARRPGAREEVLRVCGLWPNQLLPALWTI